jgi:hypothetical protein
MRQAEGYKDNSNKVRPRGLRSRLAVSSKVKTGRGLQGAIGRGF